MQQFDKALVSKRFTLLYVEDQPDIQKEFVDILSFFVDELFVASNGEEGLKLYHEHLPDIIISDIQMPVMNGLQMIKSIRKNDEDIPIIITTAFNDSNYLLEAITLGVEHYLLKPVMLDQLQNKLERAKKQLMQKRELDAYQLYLEDRVNEEVALGEAKEMLLLSQNKDAEIGQMVSIIAHQWKQPLHYLHLLIEDLGYEFAEGTLDKAFMNDFIEKGTQRVKFLSDTMDNFLSFYKSHPTVKLFSISEVIKDLVFFLSDPFRALGVKLEIEIERDFRLKGIENEFQQVLLNLINNAKEAFRGQKIDNAYVRVRVFTQEGQGLVEVCDNAGGIPSAILTDIFKMEYTTKEDGNGIGLYLVDKIVTKRFEGTISVENSSEGACFTLRFNSKEKLNVS